MSGLLGSSGVIAPVNAMIFSITTTFSVPCFWVIKVPVDTVRGASGVRFGVNTQAVLVSIPPDCVSTGWIGEMTIFCITGIPTEVVDVFPLEMTLAHDPRDDAITVWIQSESSSICPREMRVSG